jgi:hypothetical protein
VLFGVHTQLALLAVEPPVRAHPARYGALLALGILFLVVSTIRWQNVQRREVACLVYGYFGVQLCLIVVMILLERPYVTYNVTTAALALLASQPERARELLTRANPDERGFGGGALLNPRPAHRHRP